MEDASCGMCVDDVVVMAAASDVMDVDGSGTKPSEEVKAPWSLMNEGNTAVAG